MLRLGRRSRPVVLAGLLSISQLGAPARGEEANWLYCAPSFVPLQGLSSPELLRQFSDDKIRFSADQIELDNKRYYLQGNVIGRRTDQELLADSIVYDVEQDKAVAEGNVRYQNDQRIAAGNSAEYYFAADRGLLGSARFWFSARHLRGDAREIRLLSPSLTQLKSARLTSCDPGKEDWILSASTLNLDTEAGEGEAYNTLVRFQQLPIFYFPYFTFPLDDRRITGFLTPSLGESTISGTELSLPYYWNIAPDRDATFTPRIMSKRGTLWETEFRYLNESNQGQLDVGHLPGDSVYGADRSSLVFHHQGNPAPAWRTRLEYRYVSDSEFLDDFSLDINTTSITHLERLAEAEYRQGEWNALLRVQDFQTVDESIAPTSRPYQRMPQLLLNHQDWHSGGFDYGAQAEVVRFNREAGVVGSRLDFQPRISHPFRADAGFLIPTLKARYTQYDLEDNEPGSDDSPSRLLPIFSLDSGLFFERELSGRGRARLQTLEPRAFFLYVPYENQQDLILDSGGSPRVFDSSLPAFGYSQLFRDNRFNGADRVGDANQLSLALTSRYLDEAGRELLRASIGQILYFEDRRVTLPGQAVQTEDRSDWITELASQWTSSLRAKAVLLMDSSDSELNQGTLDMRYLKTRRQVLRLGYRYQRDNQKQVDLAAIWPLTANWNMVGRWLHSLQDDVTLDTLAGLEYDSCCWALRVVHQTHRSDVSDIEARESFWIQLELKGLNSVGSDVEDLLSRDILTP